MAEVVDSFEFGRKGPPAIYDWTLWFNGQVWKLAKGVDYHVDNRSFQTQATTAARRMGKNVKTAGRTENGIQIVFIQAFDGE